MRSPRSIHRGPQLAGWTPSTTADRAYAVRTVPNVSIPLSDGTLLAADLYLPVTDDKLPALLGWSPYNKDLFPTGAPAPFNEPGDVTFFARRGYPVVIVNTRGTGRSTGELPLEMFSESELEDLRQTFAWIADQPWCDGRVGMTGMSYFGINQLFAAGHRVPHLAAAAPFGSATDIYRMVAYQTGALHSGFLSPYVAVNGAVQKVRLPTALRHALGYLVGTAPIQALARKALWHNLPRLIRHLSPPAPWLRRWAGYALENPLDGPFYRNASAWPRLSDIEVPVLLGTEWSMVGLHLLGTFEAWHRIPGPKKMFIGPRWDQWPFLRYQQEIASFYDHVLKDVDNGYDALPAVRYWLHGAERWESATDWPASDSRSWTMHLGTSPTGVGHLSAEPPADAGSQSWAALPLGLAYPGAFDRHGPYPRVIRYESDPMDNDVHVAGPAEVLLHLTSSAMDTLVQARLSDMAPNGSIPPPLIALGKGSHGSILSGNYAPIRLSSGWKSTGCSLIGLLPEAESRREGMINGS
jgi:putative CocE/NonD family hydrolase